MRSKADLVYERLKNELVTCVRAPGQRIVQAEVAKAHGFGLAPVREAMQRLTHEGLLYPEARTGFVVTPVALSDLHELYEFRLILETSAIELAAERASDSELEALVEKAKFTYHYECLDSYSDFLRQNTTFHQVIARYSGNRMLHTALGATLEKLTRVFYLALDLTDNSDEISAEHLQLATALKARDPELAADYLKAQVDRSQKKIVGALMDPSSMKAQRLRIVIQE